MDGDTTVEAAEILESVDAIHSKLLDMMDTKKNMEAEIKELLSILESHGVSMDTSLIDSEGYPRPDLDIGSICRTRKRIKCLRNDMMILMVNIEKGLHELHAQAKVGTNSFQNLSLASPQYPTHSIPFLEVKFVSEKSPAAVAGLQIGDKITAFGNLTHSTFGTLRDITELVKFCIRTPVTLECVRNGELKTMSLIPGEKDGKVFLGCSLDVIKP